MTRQGSPQAVEALEWLARLPFLGVDDLALLTGRPEPDIEGVLREMKQDGLVDALTPSTPELDGAAVHVLTEPSRRWLAVTIDAAAVRTLPLAWRDIVQGLARLEATVALNVFAAGLVASLHRSADREVAELHALPVRRPQDAWWPPGVQAYGCIRAAAGAAPFFVAVDRAGAPAAHRAALVAGWYRFGESSQPWGSEIPPILVLCPGRTREDDWARAVIASAERRNAVPLRVLLAGAAAGAGGSDAHPWRRADGASRAGLMEWLPVWHTEHLSLPSARMPDLLPGVSSEERQPLQRWAREVATGARKATTLERAAAVALATSTVEKAAIDCLARHPLLSEAELAAALQLDLRVVGRAVERVATLGLIGHVERPGDQHRRYCLSSAALHALAIRDGVPVRRYARHAPVTVLPASDGERTPTLLQQYDHTVGANSLFIAWLGSAAGGPQLLSWLSAAESAIRFESGGRRLWVRPDGAGELRVRDEAFLFLLEWDRGTERVAILGTKLTRYAEYFRSFRASGEPARVLLFVTTTPQREDLVWRVAASALGPDAGRLLTTTDSLIERLTPRGCIWRRQTDSPRQHWPSSPTPSNPKR